jgi:peptide/nickel transport system permease protein
MKFLVKRFFIAVFSLWSVFTIVFFIIHLIPGDPVELMLGEGAQRGDVEKMREELGLNKPIIQQYTNYFKNMTNGTLGKSIAQNRAVSEIIGERIFSTVKLALGGILIAIILSFPLGILSSYKEGKLIDKLSTGISVLGIAIPNFVLGPLLIIIFSIKLNLLPVAGEGGLSYLILPSLTLGTGLAAILTRIIKTSLDEEKGKEYIKTLEMIGFSKKRIWIFHILKNAMIPIITILALQFGALLTGTIITETVFSWQGIGTLLISSIRQRDYPLIEGLIIFISFIYIVSNLIADILYVFVDPRIRLKGATE